VALPDNEYVTSDIRSVDTAALAVSLSEIKVKNSNFYSIYEFLSFSQKYPYEALLVIFTGYQLLVSMFV